MYPAATPQEYNCEEHTLIQGPRWEVSLHAGSPANADPHHPTPDAWCADLQMKNRNLLGGPEGKAGFKNRETWTRLLWFLERT